MQIDLQVGGESIRIREAEERLAFAWPEWPFDLFQSSPLVSPDIDIQVTVVKKLPELEHGAMIFDADQGLWKLYESPGGYYLETFNTETHQPYTRAFVSPDFGRVRLWILEVFDRWGQEHWGWIPGEVFNPIVEICLVTRIARQGGVLLHASSVRKDARTYVFSGPSGAGKTTIMEFFIERIGATGLSDERTILRKKNGQIQAYGTPWHGTGRRAANEFATLDGFFMISHAVEAHEIGSLSVVDWTRRFLHECTLPHWDRSGMEQTMVFLEDLMLRSKCRELTFLKDPSVVEYVRTYPVAALAPSIS